jgi:hypothetical protein
MNEILKKKTNIFYVRNFISLIIIISYLRSKKNKNSSNTLIINYQYFSKKIVYKCIPFLKKYFNSIEFINYKKNHDYSSNKIFGYYFKRSQEIKRFSEIIRKIILKYNIKNIYTGGDDIELAISKIKNAKISTYYIEHGHGNLNESIINAKKFRYYQYLYKLIILILFKLNFLYYSSIRWKGYVTILGNRFTNKFFKKNFIRSVCLNGFSPFVKKLLVKPKHMNLEIDRLTESLKIKKPSKKNYILLNFGGSNQHQDLNQFKILMKKILNIVDKKKDIILIKDKKINIDRKVSLQKIIVKVLIKKKIKVIYLSQFPISSLPSEVVIRLFNIKKIISEISSVPYFSDILFSNIKIYIFKNYFLTNKNQPLVSKYKEVTNLYIKKFSRINFY